MCVYCVVCTVAHGYIIIILLSIHFVIDDNTKVNIAILKRIIITIHNNDIHIYKLYIFILPINIINM